MSNLKGIEYLMFKAMKNIFVSLSFIVSFAFGWWLSNPFDNNQPKSYARCAEEKLCAINESLNRYYQLKHRTPDRLSELQESGLIDESSLNQNWIYDVFEGTNVVIYTKKNLHVKKEMGDKGISIDYIVRLETSMQGGAD